jgi:flavin reductase (DIM6/NTAB) family NADH-FMN oxidoreductase RutF
MVIDPQTTPIPDLHQFMIAAVAPRPIAFVSTVDAEGRPNLAPYSFFNAFSSNPPIVVFSSNRRVQDGTTKDTLANVEATRECVINMVSFDIVNQMSIASVNFPKGVSEFVKAGLTPIKSDLVRAFRVAEAKVQMECQVQEILPLGTEGGAGHLVICRVIRLHINDDILDTEKRRIDPHKIDLVGRMGKFYYARASGDAVFEQTQTERPLVIGFDSLPQSILKSEVLTGNQIAQFAGLQALPPMADIVAIRDDVRVQKALRATPPLRGLHLLAQDELKKKNIEFATKVALLSEYL